MSVVTGLEIRKVTLQDHSQAAPKKSLSNAGFRLPAFAGGELDRNPHGRVLHSHGASFDF